MRFEFVESVFRKLLAEQVIRKTDSVLAVCAGHEERRLFASLAFVDVTISNLDERIVGAEFAPFQWSFQDAQNLTFHDKQFDFVFVSDGLHHCLSPHRAMLEMYRVARKGIVVFEGRDSLLLRLAIRMNLVPEYELEAVVDNNYRFGGVNNTQIPNYIYRWTEREFEKTIRSCDPIGKHSFRFYHGLSLPYGTSSMRKSNLKLYIVKLVAPFISVLARLFVKQNNLFAMIAIRPATEDVWPWLETGEGEPRFKRDYADALFKSPSST